MNNQTLNGILPNRLLLAMLFAPTLAFSQTASTDKLSSIFGAQIDQFKEGGGGDIKTSHTLISRLVDIGMQENPVLQAEQHRVSSAEAAVDTAKAAFQPVAGLSASLGRAQTDESTDKTKTLSDSGRAGITIRQNLWRGGVDSDNIRAASADEKVAQLQYKSQRATLVYEISKAAINFHAVSIKQKIATAASEDAKEILSLSEKKFKAGQSGKLDVYRASMRASEATASAEKSLVQVNQALHQLLKNLGKTQPESIKEFLSELAAKPIPLPKNPPSEKVTAITLSEEIADQTVEKSDYLLGKARKTRYFPEIDAVAEFSRTLSESESTVSTLPIDAKTKDADKTNRTAVSLELTWPLWSRQRDHQITQAWHEKSVALAKAEQAKIAAFHAGQETHARLDSLYRSLPALQAAFNQADALYKSQRKLYDAGAVDVFAVNESDSQRVNALGNWYDTIVEIHQAYIRLAALQAGLVLP